MDISHCGVECGPCTCGGFVPETSLFAVTDSYPSSLKIFTGLTTTCTYHQSATGKAVALFLGFLWLQFLQCAKMKESKAGGGKAWEPRLGNCG